MKKNFLKVAIILSFISSCTPARISNISIPKNQKSAEVTVIRDSSFRFILVESVFGYDGQDYLTLSDGQTKRLKVSAGNHEFFIRSNQADRKFNLSLKVEDGEKICLRVKTSDELTIIKLIFPFMFWLTNAFDIKQEKC